MPQIIVTAERPTESDRTPVLLCERVSETDFESDHFQAQLVERIGWAVSDASEVEQDQGALERGGLQREIPAQVQEPAPALTP